MTPPLEEVLESWREQAKVLRLRKHHHDAELIDQLCDDVAGAAKEYLEWVSEEDAIRRTRHRRSWLRGRFAEWERAGHARYRNRKREYRLIVLPIGANESAAYEAGKGYGRIAS